MAYPRAKCFVIEPTGEVEVWLRRYSHRTNEVCPIRGFYHDAHTVIIKSIPAESTAKDYEGNTNTIGDFFDHGDPRWPTHCQCGYEMKPYDEWQYFPQTLYRRLDDPSVRPFLLRDAPVGALWRSEHMEEYERYRGVDGQSWTVRTYGGDWLIDGPANNCTMKDDRVHKCWCRHGTAPEFHVDKNGVTCQAGAGSIVCGDYHGFLHNGWLTEG